MQKRSPAAVFLLALVTLGLYSWYWSVKTKGEMNKLGETIPTAWIWLIPIVGILWWQWKYAEGVEHVTKGKMSAVMAFILLWLLGSIGQAIIQDSYNKLDASAAPDPMLATPAAVAATPAAAPIEATPATTSPEPITPDVPPTPPTQPPAAPPAV